MASDNWEPIYREWSSGLFEQALPESRDDFDANHRLRRVERLRDHIVAGADRSMCRNFVYTEEEWRSGCRMAGKEPGDGWLHRPSPGERHLKLVQPEPERDTPEPIGAIFDTEFDF